MRRLIAVALACACMATVPAHAGSIALGAFGGMLARLGDDERVTDLEAHLEANLEGRQEGHGPRL